jgi:hypothetical protein
VPHATGLLRLHCEGPRRRAAEKRHDLASFQLTKSHPRP